MGETIAARLAAMGVTIPQASTPAANYLPWTRVGNLIYTSGQLPLENGKLIATGKLGAAVSLEEGQNAARQCAINILAQAQAAIGDLENIKQLVKLTSFVSSVPEFTEQHIVTNGASDFMVDVLGDAGRHARSAVGMPVLPMDAAVEIEAIIEVK